MRSVRGKLALNNWLAVLAEGMAECLTLSSALALERRLFVETVAGGPPASAYAAIKSNAMLEADFAPGFPPRHGAPDNTTPGRPDIRAPDRFRFLLAPERDMVEEG